jgi:hypothetical protein
MLNKKYKFLFFIDIIICILCSFIYFSFDLKIIKIIISFFISPILLILNLIIMNIIRNKEKDDN